MWPRWGRSSRPSTTPSFSFPTFKDVQSLIDDKPFNPNAENPNPRKVSSIFHRVRITAAVLRSWNSAAAVADKNVVVYFTSLRVVRKTFDDCRFVLSILKGFRISVDERDVSMDARFMKELHGIFGGRVKLVLPKVFIGGKYVGGAEEILKMHENGELKKTIEGFPTEKGGVCESCGGVRFVLCYTCNGSHKFYLDKRGFRSCTLCNENGLIKCPSCCS